MNNQPKLLTFFLSGLASGGAEKAMLTLTDEFAKQGRRVDLVVCNARGAFVGSIPAQVRLVDLGSSRILFSLPSLIRYLRREQPYAMLSMLPSANCLAVWAKVISRVSTQLIVSEQSVLSIASKTSHDMRVKLLPTLMKWTYPLADNIVAVSSGVADDLASCINLKRSSIKVIYNPVVSQSLIDASRQPIDHPWFKSNQPPVIVSVGRLVKLKDYETLIRAFHIVQQTRTSRLVILGEGEERKALEKLISDLGLNDSVQLLGFVDNPYPYIRGASVFALASHWEGFGNVIVESLACDTPVVSADCPCGPSEILEGGKHGKLVPVGDSKAMANAITETLTTQTVQLSDRADSFKVNRIVEQYSQLLCKDASQS